MKNTFFIGTFFCFFLLPTIKASEPATTGQRVSSRKTKLTLLEEAEAQTQEALDRAMQLCRSAIRMHESIKKISTTTSACHIEIQRLMESARESQASFAQSIAEKKAAIDTTCEEILARAKETAVVLEHRREAIDRAEENLASIMQHLLDTPEKMVFEVKDKKYIFDSTFVSQIEPDCILLSIWRKQSRDIVSLATINPDLFEYIGCYLQSIDPVHPQCFLLEEATEMRLEELYRLARFLAMPKFMDHVLEMLIEKFDRVEKMGRLTDWSAGNTHTASYPKEYKKEWRLRQLEGIHPNYFYFHLKSEDSSIHKVAIGRSKKEGASFQGKQLGPSVDLKKWNPLRNIKGSNHMILIQHEHLEKWLFYGLESMTPLIWGESKTPCEFTTFEAALERFKQIPN